jgi:hypothetical protein
VDLLVHDVLLDLERGLKPARRPPIVLRITARRPVRDRTVTELSSNDMKPA